MTFSPIGPWATNQKLLSTEMNDIDTNLSNALDTVGGGNYNALAAPLSISGDNINLGAGTDTVTVGNGATSTFIANAATDFQRGVNSSAGSNTFNGATSFGSSGSVSLQGPVALSDPMTISSNGRIIFRAPVTITDAPGTLTPVTSNHYRCAAATLGADRIWLIDDTNCANGDWLYIATEDTGFTVIVHAPGAVLLSNLKSGTAATAMLAMRVAGTWIRFNHFA